MNRFLLLCLITLLPITLAVGQDFKKVVDIVVDMETSLKKMIASEETQRKSEVAGLKKEIVELRASLAPSGESGKVARDGTDLEQRLTSLEAKVGSLPPSPDIKVLAAQLSSLLSELRKSIDETRKPAPVIQPPPSIQVGGQVFGLFSYTSSGIDGNGSDRFDLDRMYLTAKGQAFDGAKVQLTTDLYRNSASGSYYAGMTLRIKFAMLDYAPTPTVSIKVGLIPTVWPGFVDGIWKYRGVQKSATDRLGYTSTADLGLSVSYLTPDKAYELSGFILNGNGYDAPESNRFKDVGFRMNMTPFADTPLLKPLLLAAYGYKGANANAGAQALQRDRFGGLLSFSNSGITASAEYDIRKDAPSNPDTTVSGNVLSAFGEIKAPFGNTLSVIWRYDIAEPDANKGGDMSRLLILGISYKPNDKLTLVLDHQSVYAEAATLKKNDGSKTRYDGRMFVHLILSF